MRSLSVTPKMLESERQVVMEERRLRVDNEIAGMMDEELATLVYKAHPYRWPVIGWMKDIEQHLAAMTASNTSAPSTRPTTPPCTWLATSTQATR